MPLADPDDAMKFLHKPDIEIIVTDDTVCITCKRDINLSELLELLRQSGIYSGHGEYPI